MHFFDSSHRKACLIRHHEHTLPGVFVVNSRHADILFVSEYVGAALCIVSFDLKVKLARQPRLELIGKPAVPEVREDGLCDVHSKLDHGQVSINIFLNPTMLDLDRNNFTCAPQSRLVDLA